MNAFEPAPEPFLDHAVAAWSGDLAALILLLISAIATVASRRARWHGGSSLVVLAVGLFTVAKSPTAVWYAAEALLAGRCARFVTIKLVAIAPVSWLQWAALVTLAGAVWAYARAWRSLAAGTPRRAAARRWLLGLLGAAALHVGLTALDAWCDGQGATLRHRYYYGWPPYDRCMSGQE